MKLTDLFEAAKTIQPKSTWIKAETRLESSTPKARGQRWLPSYPRYIIPLWHGEAIAYDRKQGKGLWQDYSRHPYPELLDVSVYCDPLGSIYRNQDPPNWYLYIVPTFKKQIKNVAPNTNNRGNSKAKQVARDAAAKIGIPPLTKRQEKDAESFSRSMDLLYTEPSFENSIRKGMASAGFPDVKKIFILNKACKARIMSPWSMSEKLPWNI